MRRVIAYIDGFNLYYGLRARYRRRYHWLDLERLVVSLLPPMHYLERLDYFTARIRNQPQSIHRQAAYLTALAACCPRIRIVEGRFQQTTVTCSACGGRRVAFEEKETDVNIAANMISDAALDAFDTAILISADGDLAPAIMTARRLRPTARFYAALPPRRRSDALSRVTDATFTIGEGRIRGSLLPDKIVLPSGVVLERPAYWR
jgi:uncharacterized LabA/DUF88 family protein